MRRTVCHLLAVIALDACLALSAAAENVGKINEDALALLRKGKTQESIRLWESVPQPQRTAEMLNNLGYAYYVRSRQYFDGTYGDESFFNRDYEKAKTTLQASKQMESKRWSVYLNLGDLYFSYGQMADAMREYQTLLFINPDYKHADRINAKIRLISRELELAKKAGFKPLVVEVHPSKPLLVFRLNSENDEYGPHYTDISVLVGDDTKVSQTLECDMIDGGAIYAPDFNFDGYLDLFALSYKGSGHNYGYCNWLYDRKSGTFKPNTIRGEKEEVEIVGPYIDYRTKMIRTTYSGSNGHSSTDYYHYSNDGLVLTKNLTVEALPGDDEIVGYRRTIRKNVNGKMVLESEKVVSEPEEAFSHLWK